MRIFDNKLRKMSIGRDERIKYVLANKDNLTRAMLAQRWGMKMKSVSDFLRKHELPKLPVGSNQNTERSIADELKKRRIDYVLKNHKQLSLHELAEYWGIKPYSVSAFLLANDLPELPTYRQNAMPEGVRLTEADCTYKNKYRNIEDMVLRMKWMP